MKFSEMPYAQPDLNELKQQLQSLTDQLKAAPDYDMEKIWEELKIK